MIAVASNVDNVGVIVSGPVAYAFIETVTLSRYFNYTIGAE